MARESLATRLYHGEISWDVIGRRRLWYAFSSLVMLVGVVSLALRGVNPSIEFTGGAQFQAPINGHSTLQVQQAVLAAGVNPQIAVTTGSGSNARFDVQTQTLTTDQVTRVQAELVDRLGVNPNDLSITTIGSTWGSEITHKALIGLGVFLVAVVGYLSLRFEWKMALAAIIALIHDLVITAGIYSLSGFQVSPSTVIALLTILGYSLYDTVVVFDKVRENTAGIAGGSKMTFTQAANLAVNQTLVRSINTSIIALLPVLGLLVVGAGLLGAGSLDDLSVALLIGLASGAYSSIFIATPLLCDLKEREPTYQQLAMRVARRRHNEALEADVLPGMAAGTTVAGVGGESADAAPQLVDPDDDGVAEAAMHRQKRTPPRPGVRSNGGQGRRTRRSRKGQRVGKAGKRR